ncbi:MAG: hypothetical protein M5U28_05880 [Sandaracinaceae bacterium]|nr:hypothetical protein [Sandaracinaceae bacterium]
MLPRQHGPARRGARGDAGAGLDASRGPRDAGRLNRCVAVAETCNDADDDCDGDVDEDLYRPCARECGTGVEICRDGRYRDCTAPRGRECDDDEDIDEDADEDIDEDIDEDVDEDVDEDEQDRRGRR